MQFSIVYIFIYYHRCVVSDKISIISPSTAIMTNCTLCWLQARIKNSHYLLHPSSSSFLCRVLLLCFCCLEPSGYLSSLKMVINCSQTDRMLMSLGADFRTELISTSLYRLFIQIKISCYNLYFIMCVLAFLLHEIVSVACY